MARPVRGPATLLACLLMALVPWGMRAQTVLTDTNITAGALAVPDYWLPCGKATRCSDPSACCAIWGVCGYTDRFCGQYCLSGNCYNNATVASSPPPGKSMPPPPAVKQPTGTGNGTVVPTVDPALFTDAIVSVREGEVALAGCSEPGWVITSVENAMYGNVATKCNSTLTFRIVWAACVGQPTCIIPAVNAVFDDPCRGTYKILQFGYRCRPEAAYDPSTGLTITLSPSPPPPKSVNPFASSPPPPPPKSLSNPFTIGNPPINVVQPGPSSLPPPPTRSSPPPSPLPPSPRPPSPRPPSPRPPSPRPPSASPPPPSPRPPSPRPPSPPPPNAGVNIAVAPSFAPVPANAEFSLLWGRSGELFTHRSQLTDWSQAGYAANNEPIPDYPVKYNVKDFGAKGDGTTDDTKAFLAAVSLASEDAKASGSGVAVLAPAGRYRITQALTIDDSYVVLRGDGPSKTTLYYPYPLAQIYGSGKVWAFGGTWLTVLGKNPDSSDSRNYITAITADVPQGSKRVMVGSTSRIKAGQWLRVFVTAPNNTGRRRARSLLGNALANQAAGGQQLRPVLAGRRQLSGARHKGASELSVQEAGAPAPAPATGKADIPLVAQLLDDPQQQAALNASFVAMWELQQQVASNPDKVPAQWYDPDALNPGGLDPWLLAAARYAAAALLADMDEQRVPSVAVDGTLDAYLYGENIVDSGNGDVYPDADHIRFVSRVAAVGSNWIEFERALPYDVRKQWKPVIHSFAPTVQHSGFEGFTVEFPWSPYPSHLDVKGFNAIGIYDAVNCWVRNVATINADNGVIVNGADFVTVAGVTTDITKRRGEGSVGDRNGHHALWIQQSSNVLMTDFLINYRWYHDLSLAIFSESCVYSNGTGSDLNIDSHRGGTHHNLLSNINVGLGTRPFRSGGEDSRGAHSGANVTWWNIYAADGKPLKLPPCDFGPLLNFVGSWQAPDAKAASVPAPPSPMPLADDGGSATAQSLGKVEVQLSWAVMEAAPAAAAAPATAAAPGPDTALEQAQQDGAVDKAVAAWAADQLDTVEAYATMPNWCSKQKWRVEQLDAGRQLYPRDLASAMVWRRNVQGGVL